MKRKLYLSICSSCVAGALATLILAGVGATAAPSLAAPLLTTWYVDATTGDDNNDCLTPTTACLTVGEAVSRAGADDTVQIAAGVYEESIDIMLPLTLIGAGTDDTLLDGGDAQRVVATSNNPVTLANLTVRNGRITDANGGGIFNIGTLILDNVLVTGNTAVNGGGGGIFNNGILVLINSEVSGNSSDGVGGGIYTWYGSITDINVSRVSSNTGHQGGGLYNLGTLDMNDTTVSDNSATGYSGGGLIIFDGNVTLDRVTFSGNQTVSNGGGISNQIGTLSLTNSTLSGNSASQYGGLANEGANAQTTILNSTIAYNMATGAGTRTGGVGSTGGATITFQNSVVAENDGRNCQVGGNWTSGGHNLSSDSYCAFNSSGDLPNTPAALAPLASYNGSPTEMHGLHPGSSAIDGGDTSGCPFFDQRGVTRPVDGDGDGTAVCDIGAFEARQQLVVSDVTVIEGDSGMTTTAVFTVTLSPAGSQPVTVEYATADGTAEAGSDYTAQSDTLTFAPGQVAHLVTIDVTGDDDDEPDQTFTLNLSNAGNADIIDAQGVATIVDDDGLPFLSVADVTVDEGNYGMTIAQFTVTLSPASAGTVMVDYATINGTAVAGSDYTAAGDTLTFTPGQTMKLVDISIQGDTVDEGDSESFILQLTNPVNAGLADDEAVGTILDDEAARVGVQPGPAVYEGHSGTTTAVFTIILNNPAAFTVTVDYETTSGAGNDAATPGVDYESMSGTLVFAPGQTTHTVAIPIYGDIEKELDEHFDLLLSNASPVSIYANISTGLIIDDDEDTLFIYLPFVVRP